MAAEVSGACLWRLSKKERNAGMGEGNRLAMKRIFDDGHVPGLVAIQEGEAVGRTQIDRRTSFPRLEGSRDSIRSENALGIRGLLGNMV